MLVTSASTKVCSKQNETPDTVLLKEPVSQSSFLPAAFVAFSSRGKKPLKGEAGSVFPNDRRRKTGCYRRT